MLWLLSGDPSFCSFSSIYPMLCSSFCHLTTVTVWYLVICKIGKNLLYIIEHRITNQTVCTLLTLLKNGNKEMKVSHIKVQETLSKVYGRHRKLYMLSRLCYLKVRISVNLEKSCLCDTWGRAYMVLHKLGFIVDQCGCILDMHVNIY
jgi:hypothetical protein